MVMLGISRGRHPMANLYEVLSFVALTLEIVYFIIEIWRKNRMTGVFIMPVAFILQTISSLFIKKTTEAPPFFSNIFFGLHSSFFALSYSAFFLSGTYGIMLLIFYNFLKQRKFGTLFERMPSLNTLAKMNRGAALTGFIFMTAAIGVGILWACDYIPQFLFDAKVIVTLITWLLYGISLLSHYLFKMDIKKVAILNLVALVMLVIMTMVANIPGLISWHRFEG
jgi:ABC-type uncharacterized transport system permease subunit